MNSVIALPEAGVADADLYDAVIIGAGMAGMYQLYRLRQLGLRVKVVEAGTDVGGTWYWNRYPGARFDSESWSYGFSFSPEVLQEWSWVEHFSAQPDTLRYLNYIADKFDLRKDMQFSSRVVAARYHENGRYWEIETEGGGRVHGRLMITALGPLSAYTEPRFDGMADFLGQSFHTARWPRTEVKFEGKRVAVIGTGASGIQTIQEVAKTASHLTVFQRTANYCAPLHNSRITEEEQAKIKASYPEIFARCQETAACFVHMFDSRSVFDVSPEEREAFFEKLYAEPGFGILQGNFHDILSSTAANDLISDFVKKKIRQRVRDPKVAEKLIPTNHGFGTRRLPLETRYFEVYNQDNVLLVDIRDTPIERITPLGIKTSEQEYPFDIIIYATGFDAVTGGFDRIDIRGTGGQRLRDKWDGNPKTLLGLQVAGFPNMLTLVGPHNVATRCNIPRCIEQNVEWVTDLVKYMREHNLTRVEATPEAEKEWTDHVIEIASGMLIGKTPSWYTGVNSNVPGRDKPRVITYQGGAPAYRQRCEEVARSGYAGFALA